VAGESISIPILTPGADVAARNIKGVGNAAAQTAGELDVAAASLELWNATALKSAKADQTLIASKRSHAKADALLADAENVLAGRATKTTKLLADQGRVVDDAGKTAVRAAGGFSALAGGGGGIAGGGMGALIGAGVALAPVIVTVGVGLAGLAAAAYGIAKPISQAAQATGGLQANLGKLGPEQQQVALGLLGLGKQFATFQKNLQPTVLGLFTKGLALAGTLLRSVEPVAAATGKALGSTLSQIGAVFRSGEWQGFFAFMARTAGPDIQLLTQNFTDLLKALPPLVQELQPLSRDVLIITDGIAKLAGRLATWQQSLDQTGKHENTLAQITDGLRKLLIDPGYGLGKALALLHITGSSAGKGLSATAAGAKAAVTPAWSLNAAIAALNTSMTTLVGNLLTLQGNNVAWRQSMQAAEAQLKSNTAGLAGNTKNALANKQAIIASTNAAIQFAANQLTLGKNIGGASSTIQAQIKFLQSLHDKSKFTQDEIHALREEEAKLAAERINQRLTVKATGQWSVVGVGPYAGKQIFATGGLVPGTGTGDTVPAMLTPGEAVVPKRLTPAVAPFLRANKVPGFAAGGLVPSYTGDVAGLRPWVKRDDAATIRLIDQAVARATLAGIRSTLPTGIGGNVAGWINASLQFNRLPGWWAPLMAVLVSKESGGNPRAYNPISVLGQHAEGIAQMLPSTFAAYSAGGSIWNPVANLVSSERYIRAVYGNPRNIAGLLGGTYYGYDRGGILPPGITMAVNATGRPEMVTPARGAAGNTYNITVHTGPATPSREVGRVLVEHIRAFEHGSGKGWRS